MIGLTSWHNLTPLRKLITLKQVKNASTSAVKKTVSGSIVHIEDALAKPLKSIVVNIDPVQSGSGNPSPDNIRPITGWTGAKVTRTGKNLIPFPYHDKRTQIAGVNITYNDDGSILLNGTVESSFYVDLSRAAEAFAIAGGTYTLRKPSENGTASIVCVRNGSYFRQAKETNTTFTLPEDSKLNFYITASTGTVFNNVVVYPMMVYGTEVSEYESYQADTYDIVFPSEAGTVYGGTLDVTNGVLTVDRAMSDLGTLTWSYNSGKDLFTATLSGFVPKNYNRNGNNNILCSAYPEEGWNQIDSQSGATDKTIHILWISGTATNIWIADRAYSTASEFKSAISGVQLVYELANTIEYQLTPQEVTTLLGTNNIWADTGDVEVTYLARGI